MSSREYGWNKSSYCSFREMPTLRCVWGVVRVRGIGLENVWCKKCLLEALPFLNIEGESDFQKALREYREGLRSRAGDFQGLKFDPFGEEERGALGLLDGTLKGRNIN